MLINNTIMLKRQLVEMKKRTGGDGIETIHDENNILT